MKNGLSFLKQIICFNLSIIVCTSNDQSVEHDVVIRKNIQQQ